jgi:transposase
MTEKKRSESIVREIRLKTHKKYTAEEKIRIVLEGLRGEDGITELCRREGIHTNLYYKWSKEFLEAGKQRLVGDIKRQAISTKVVDVLRMTQSNDNPTDFIAQILLQELLDKSKGACNAAGAAFTRT